MSWAKIRYWTPFSLRTAAFGTLSVTTGPLTRGRTSVWCARRWSQSSARALGIEIDVEGVERLPKPPYLIASNHQSLLDILVLGAVLPGDFKWAAKRSLMKVPFLGWHLHLAGHVPVDRGQGQEAARAVTEAFESVLRRDLPLLVFPEGTVTADGSLGAFKLGGFRAAANVDCPVVPVALEGTHRLMPKGVKHPELFEPITGPRPVSIRIGEPLRVDSALGPDARLSDLRDRTRASVGSMLDTIAK